MFRINDSLLSTSLNTYTGQNAQSFIPFLTTSIRLHIKSKYNITPNM